MPLAYKQARLAPLEHDAWKRLGNLLMLAEEFLTREEYEAVTGKLRLDEEVVGDRAKIRFQFCVSQVVREACGQEGEEEEEGGEYA